MAEVVSIVLTGGPCAGKTSSMAFLQEKLTELGIHAIVTPEVATDLLMGGVGPKTLVGGNTTFQRRMLKHVIEQENAWRETASELDAERVVLLHDRGTMDGLAYTEPEVFAGILKPFGGTVAVRDERYRAVIHLRTTALGAEKFYTLANNSARFESPEQAQERDEQTLRAWVGHPHLRVVDNSTGFRKKKRRALAEILHVLGIPIPVEIENKYKVRPPEMEYFPVHHRAIDIVQHYLVGNTPDTEERVRRRGMPGSWVHFHTIKRTLSEGVRSEEESIVDKKTYERLLRRADPERQGVAKKRVCFVHNNQYFELDLFVDPQFPFALLELELTQEGQKVSLPDFLEIEEDVTGNPAYSNSMLARGIVAQV